MDGAGSRAVRFNGLNNVADGRRDRDDATGAGGVPANGIAGTFDAFADAVGDSAKAPALTGATRQSLVMANETPIVCRTRTGMGTSCFRRIRLGWECRADRWGI